MANISVTATGINGETFTAAKTMSLVALNIKAARQNLTGCTISYYDEQSAILKEIEVSNSVHAIFVLMILPALITVESWDSILENKGMLLEQNSYAMAVALSVNHPLSIAYLTITAATGTYATGDTLYNGATAATSPATGTIISSNIAANGTAVIVYHPTKGTFAALDVINVNGGATNDTVAAQAAANQKVISYQGGKAISQKKKDIIAYVGVGTTTKAVDAVSRTAKSITIAAAGGDLRTTFIKDAPFYVDGSTDYDGIYTTLYSTYNSATTKTTVFVREGIPGAASNGNVLY